MPPAGGFLPKGGVYTNKKPYELCVRVTEIQKNKLMKDAKKCGLKLNPYIRRLIMGAAVQARPPAIAQELYVEINRIGNNINQIARSVNAGIASPEDARQALFLLAKVYQKLDEAVKR